MTVARKDGRVRVALIASHVIQYQDPFFRMLASVPEIELTVIFCSRAGAEPYRDEDMKTTLRWDLEMLTGYRHRFLRNFGFGQGYTRLMNPAIVPTLLFGNFDVAIFFLGWGSISSLLGLSACRARGLPYFLYGDSSLPPDATTFAQRMRARFLRMLFRSTSAFLVSGEWNARYYRHYGADAKRFFSVPWAIDNTRFEEGSRFAPGEREQMRARADISSEDMAVVFSGKLLPRKDPMTLLRAVDAMQLRQKTAVIFLGNGELRDELSAFARERSLNVHFAGFVNQTELPKHYAMADVFVLPSLDDPRATVVNEAMASGLPIVITDRCGPAGDIVQHGNNGFVFTPGDVNTLASHLDTLAADPALRARMAQRSREIISTWDYERGVSGVREALQSIAK
jgi:glycosyltransferase involved in cell wall biosynthesis